MFPDSGTDAAKIQNFPVSTVDPASGQTLVYNSVTKQWEPTTPSATGVPLTRVIGSADLSANRSLADIGAESVRLIKTTNFTADVNGRYTSSHASVKIVVTDPAGTVAGQIYSVLVGLGTMDFGSGTIYSASRMEIVRYYNGSSWSTLAPTLYDNVILGANLAVNGNTTLGDASGDTITITGKARGANQTDEYGDSYMTRDLVDVRLWYKSPYISAIPMVSANMASTIVSSAAATFILNGVKLQTTTTTGSQIAIGPTSNLATAQVFLASGASWAPGSGMSIDFSRTIVSEFGFCMSGTNPTDIFRFAVGGAGANNGTNGTLGQLYRKGFSLRVSRSGSSTLTALVGYLNSSLAYIAGASNASPIVITTFGAHGLANGDTVEVCGIVGNTAANGIWTVANVASTTFELSGSTGNGAYGTQSAWGPSYAKISASATLGSTDKFYQVYLIETGGTVSVAVGSVDATPVATLSGFTNSGTEANNMTVVFGLENKGSVASSAYISNLRIGSK